MKKVTTLAIIAIAFSGYVFMSFTTMDKTYIYNNFINSIKVSWAKDSHDFGNIRQGKPVFVEFTFTNTGNEAVIVADVVTSCGCTASDYTKEPIAPGKSSKIKVSYNAAATGAFNKTITVNFNDAANKKELMIKGNVK